MAIIDFQNLPSTSTPINATNLNAIQKFETTTGTEVATNEYIDGEQVFRKRIDTGTLPNATYKDVDTGLVSSEINVVRIQGCAKATTGVQSPLPFVSISATNCIAVSLQTTGKIRLDTGVDRSNFTQSYVDLYYTKITT